MQPDIYSVVKPSTNVLWSILICVKNKADDAKFRSGVLQLLESGIFVCWKSLKQISNVYTLMINLCITFGSFCYKWT
jgi:hypothetical protein